MDNKRIYQYLDQMLNKPICAIGRASNMLWIGIGEDIKILDRKGNAVVKSPISLHVQSTWRIISKKKEILLASSDFYSPNSSIGWSKNFEWDVQGKNLFDEKSKIWLKKVMPIYIKQYILNSLGDLELILSNEEHIEIYVNSSDDTESWRLLKSHRNEEHLVVTGMGIDFE